MKQDQTYFSRRPSEIQALQFSLERSWDIEYWLTHRGHRCLLKLCSFYGDVF